MITVVARPRVPEGNTVELTLEKIRAGILPVPADNVLDRIIEYARYHGVDVQWQKRDGYPVVVMRYTPNLSARTCSSRKFRSGPDRSGWPAAPTGPRGRLSGPRCPRAGSFNHLPETEDPVSSPPWNRSRSETGPPHPRADLRERTRTWLGTPRERLDTSPRRSAARFPLSPETAPS